MIFITLSAAAPAADLLGHITNPAAGITLSGNEVLVVVDKAGEGEILKVKFDVDGVLQFEDSDQPFEWTWDTSAVSSGEHALRARVYDRAYNRTDHEIKVAIAHDPVSHGAPTAPTPTPAEPSQVSFASPAAGATVSGSSVGVSLSVADSAIVRYVKFDLDGTLMTEVYDPPFAWSWDTAAVPDGRHTLRMRVYDPDYNRTDVEIDVIVANSGGGGGTTSGIAPAWAEQAHGALQQYKQLVDFWTARVASDTSVSFFDVGGGWNDDVELSQSLAAYWLLTGDDNLADLFRQMADAIQGAPYLGSKPEPWTQPGDRRIEQAYSTVSLDVDHSAEETTLVFPRMFYVDFGEPTNVELMTRLIWNFQDNQDATFPGEQNWAQWVNTGMLMRSPRFNARYVDFCWILPEPDDCFEPQDTVNNFRTTAPALSLAWYYGPDHYFWQDGPGGFMHAHHDAWVEGTLRQEGDKPSLVPPSKILVDNLSFGDWTFNDAAPYGEGSGWKEGAWVFRHFYHAMVADSVFLYAGGSTAQRSLAENASTIVQHAYSSRQRGDLVPLVNESYSLDRQFLQWRAESGYSGDDEVFLSNRVTKNADTRVMGYLINRERNNLTAAIEHAAEGYRDINTYLAGKITDWTDGLSGGQTGLTDQVKFEFSDAFLMAALGGSGVYDGAYPTVYYSLTDTAAQVVTLVNQRGPRNTSFWAYNFAGDREIGLKLWRMSEGAGRITVGTDSDQDGQMEFVIDVIDLPMMRKGDEVRLFVPAGDLLLVDIELVSPVSRNLAQLPDPAVGRKDYRYVDGRAYVNVHNIGMAATGPVTVRVVDTLGNQIGATQTVDLPGYTGMDPIVQTLSWGVADASRVGRVEIDPAGAVDEVTEFNNVLRVN